MHRMILLSIGLSAFFVCLVFGQNLSSEIAPAGKLRVGMIAITVLGGVADPVARFIGSKLAVTVEPVTYPKPDAHMHRASGKTNGTLPLDRAPWPQTKRRTRP